MVDDQQAQETPVKETQESPMPSEEQKTAPKEESKPQENAQGTQTELPEDAKERTKREFEKLREQLADERRKREAVESAFKTLTPKKTGVAPIYDPESGLLNEQALTETQRLAYEASQRAEEAKSAVENYHREEENKRVHTSHPEVDPNNKEKFDQTLYNITSAIMLDSMVHPENWGNEQLDFEGAVVKAKQSLSGGTTQAKEQGAKEAMEQLSPKEQASLDAVGGSSRKQDLSQDEERELLQRVRKGDKDALAQLTSRRG